MTAESTPFSSAAKPAAARIDTRTLIAIGITVFSFASAFAAGRVALRHYTPEHAALFRFLIASVALIALAVARRMPLPRRSDLPRIALMGFAGFAFYNLVLNAGQQTVSAGASSLIVNTSPVIVALMAGVLYKERLNRWTWIGFAISFSGVLVIASSTGEGLRFSTGVIYLLFGALALATYSVGQKPLLQRYSPLDFLTYAIWSATLMLLFFLPGLPEQIQTAPTEATAAVFYLGIVTSVIGYGAYAYVLSKLPASRVGSFLYLNPAVATLVAWVWLGETPTIWIVLGGALVLAGVVVVNLRGRAR